MLLVWAFLEKYETLTVATSLQLHTCLSTGEHRHCFFWKLCITQPIPHSPACLGQSQEEESLISVFSSTLMFVRLGAIHPPTFLLPLTPSSITPSRNKTGKHIMDASHNSPFTFLT